MILIQRGTENVVTLTLTEKCVIDSPVFLFEFINEQTKAKKYFISEDTSLFTYRYNEFIITEDETEDALNGVIELKPKGFWTYNVYEQQSTTNLDPADTGNLVETGKVLVVETAEERIKYNGQPQTKVVYEG